jgi:hypothetical protein
MGNIQGHNAQLSNEEKFNINNDGVNKAYNSIGENIEKLEKAIKPYLVFDSVQFTLNTFILFMSRKE